MIYGFFRFGLIGVAFIGWLLYQIFQKKKSLASLQPDIIMIAAFIAVWIFIYSQFFK